MTTDWLARLREQGRFAKRMAKDVPEALADDATTHAEAEQIARSVDSCALSFERMVEDMQRASANPALLRAAESVSMIWADLSKLAANRVRDLHGFQSVASKRPAG